MPTKRLAFVLALGLIGSSACSNKAELRALTLRVERLEAAGGDGSVEQRVANLEASTQKMETLIGDLDSTLKTLVGTFEQLGSALDQLTMQLEDSRAELARPPAAAPTLRPTPSVRAGRPNPNDVYAVPVAGSPFRGPKNAKVTIVRAFEFACPYCERSRQAMDTLRKDYGKDLRIVYKHFIVHPAKATLPAQAACAADRQGQFFAMERALWDKAYKVRDFSMTNMENIARDVGLNLRKFKRDITGKRCADRIKDDRDLLSRLGVSGTPTFFINGRHLSGARSVASFKTVIDEELKKANRAIRGGIKQNRYYKHVVKNGKQTP